MGKIENILQQIEYDFISFFSTFVLEHCSNIGLVGQQEKTELLHNLFIGSRVQRLTDDKAFPLFTGFNTFPLTRRCVDSSPAWMYETYRSKSNKEQK